MTKCDQKTSGDNLFLNLMHIREGIVIKCVLMVFQGLKSSQNTLKTLDWNIELYNYCTVAQIRKVILEQLELVEEQPYEWKISWCLKCASRVF